MSSSRSSADIVRQAYRLRLGRNKTIEADRATQRMLELPADDVEFVSARLMWLRCRGKQGRARALAKARRSWAEWSFALAELTELECGHVIATGELLARHCGEPEVGRAPFVHRWTLDRGQIKRVEPLPEKKEAGTGSDRTRIRWDR